MSTREHRQRTNAFARLYRGETAFDFAGRWKRWFALSGTVIVIGLLALGVRGLNFSVDFKGGTIWSVPSTATVTQATNAVNKVDSSLQPQVLIETDRETHQRVVQVETASKSTGNSALVADISSALAKISGTSASKVNVESIGASWGASISDKAVKAVIIFLIVVSLYIWLRFEGKMAIAALTALLHDILVTVGIYALSGFQVSPDTVIAFLTILGYSLYDTIVVFDRVQENTRSLASSNKMTYSDTINLSMNQVLARSLNTSFVAIIPILSILVIGAGILGATTLNDFGLALFIGLTTGAYSSIFVASPLLALLKEREPRYAEIRRRAGAGAHRLTPAAAAAAGTVALGPTSSGRGVAARLGGRGSGGTARPAAATEPEAPPTATPRPAPKPSGPARPQGPARRRPATSAAPDGPRPAVEGEATSPTVGRTPIPPRSGTRPPPRPRKKKRR